jgi:hypothetical protein
MRLFVIHDASGAIVSAAAVSEQFEGQAELVAGEGQQLALVDAGELRLPASEGRAAELPEIAAHLVAHHRIERGRLAARSPGGDAEVKPDGMIAAFGAKPAASEVPET